MPTPDRLERLTDLVLLLQGTSHPLTLDQIATRVPGYPASHGARRQAFERDKRLLRQEGIPVLTEPVPGQEQFGYRVDPGALYLPDLELDPDEQAALRLAVAAVELGDPSGRDALLKLGASGAIETRPLAALAPPAALVPLFGAVRARAPVRFSYHGEEREVAPGGLAFRHGRWYLSGWDRLRQDQRTYRVDRMEGPVEVGEPGAGEPPAPFDPATWVPEQPWRSGGEDHAHDVELLVDPVEAQRVEEEVGSAAVAERHGDGSVRLRLGVTSHRAMRSWILSLLDHAQVMGPPEFRRDVEAWLETLAGQDPGAWPGSALAGSTAVEKAPAPPAGVAPAPPAGVAPAPAPAPGPAPAASTGRGDTRARLRRLLAMVAWLARQGQVPTAELAARFGIGVEEVVRELELAACCGVPPYSPDTLLEIVVTGDTVEAFLPPEMARPRRLTPAEGFALAAAARTILAVPGADREGALAGALAKLDRALGGHQGLVVTLDRPPLLDAVRRAAGEGARLELEYHSVSTDQTTRRVVDPQEVLSLDGHWYLDAYCHRAGDRRRFRVDRIRSLRVTDPTEGEDRGAGAADAPGVPGGPRGAQAFVPGPGAVEVRLALDPGAWWLADSVPVLRAEPNDDGGGQVVLAVGGLAWLERILLQAGAGARVLAPPELIGAGPAAARRVLARYRASGSMESNEKD